MVVLDLYGNVYSSCSVEEGLQTGRTTGRKIDPAPWGLQPPLKLNFYSVFLASRLPSTATQENQPPCTTHTQPLAPGPGRAGSPPGARHTTGT